MSEADSQSHDTESHEAGDRGIRDAAYVLPFLATVLLAPPIILIFTAPVRFAGIPLIVIYIFGVWAAVILAALLLSRGLAQADAAEHPPGNSGLR